jgi:acetolactate decarboxylase
MSSNWSPRRSTSLRVPALIALGIACSASGSVDPPPSPAEPHGRDRITQVSVINALMIGRYDGLMSIAEVLRLGDFGVGTIDHLDGELIVLDGGAYQVRGDGTVSEAAPERSTPFVTVTPFDAEGEYACPRVDSLSALEARLDDALPQQNNFLAVRVDGRFDSITLRSVRRQEPPYRPLAEVAKDQSVWTHDDLSGTLVGIRCPAWVGGLNVPGYHWHFLSEDRRIGGHVLACRVREGRVRYDVCLDWSVKLDGSDSFNRADLGADLSGDVRRVERPPAEDTGANRPGH